MSKIAFFCIPAHGHTNPTIGVVNELTKMGHQVMYYSFEEFREKIEGAGAIFVSCDAYLPPAPADLEKKAGKDFAGLIEMVADTTVSLDELVCRELSEWKPDCIVSDSVCFWGKLFAFKLGIPYVCSTTTFAFNQDTAKLMNQNNSFGELVLMLMGIPRINRKMKMLREHGYQIKNFVSVIQNDNETNTIVYTSKEFQPLANTFSDKYAFIGSSIMEIEPLVRESKKPLLYIAMGSVLNRNMMFYRNCITALKDCDVEVVMVVGKQLDINELGELPTNFKVLHWTNQVQVLQNTDVFLSHCGMNSVSESLYFGVPLVLFPQHSEQRCVADRVAELKAGVLLNNIQPNTIKNAVMKILKDSAYQKNAEKLALSLKMAGGSKRGAEKILSVIAN